MRFARSLLAATVSFGIAVGTVDAQGTSFTLDVLAPAAQEVSLTVPAGGSVPLTIIRSGGPVPREGVDLSLSEFASEGGLSIPVGLTVAGKEEAPRPAMARVPFLGPLLPVRLHVTQYPAPGSYSGTLALTIPGQDSATVWRVQLTSAQELRPAALVLDQGSISLAARRAMCLWWGRRVCLGKDDVPVASVRVRDKTGAWPLEGITVRLEPGLKTPSGGFDLDRDLRVAFDGQSVEQAGTSPRAGERSVPAGKQATVRLELLNLDPGEYTIPLRFAAANSGLDDLQRLTITVRVSDGLGWAVVVLVVAALLSFVSTRVVSTLRLRAAFLARVGEMRAAWLSEEPPILPVIWLRAMLRQAEDLSRRFWLTGQAEIDARLAQAALGFGVLDRVRRLRGRLSRQIPEDMVRRRALCALDRVVAKLDAAPLGDQHVTQLGAELDAVEAWADPAKQEACYWADLVPAVQRLLAEFRPDAIDAATIGPSGRPVVDRLLANLRDAVMPPAAGAGARAALSLGEKMDVERTYQCLRVIWDLRGETDELKQAAELAEKPSAQIEDMFRVIDNAAWKRLLRCRPAVEGPQRESLDPVEAYAPITFRIVAPEDPALVNSYLMQRKLSYEWTVEIDEWRRRWDRWRPVRTLEPAGTLRVTSAVPQVVQYSPRAGGIVVKKVAIHYGGLAGPTVAPTDPIPVRESRDFRVWRIAGGADVIALAVAAIVALVSGLMVFTESPTFGTTRDYLSLFLWGAGVDKGKDFLQALASQAGQRGQPRP